VIQVNQHALTLQCVPGPSRFAALVWFSGLRAGAGPTAVMRTKTWHPASGTTSGDASPVLDDSRVCKPDAAGQPETGDPLSSHSRWTSRRHAGSRVRSGFQRLVVASGYREGEIPLLLEFNEFPRPGA
jgi:hypothetical protein